MRSLTGWPERGLLNDAPASKREKHEKQENEESKQKTAGHLKIRRKKQKQRCAARGAVAGQHLHIGGCGQGHEQLEAAEFHNLHLAVRFDRLVGQLLGDLLLVGRPASSGAGRGVKVSCLVPVHKGGGRGGKGVVGSHRT